MADSAHGNRHPDDLPQDPDELEQDLPVDPEDETSPFEDVDHPLTPDEVEQRLEVDYADEEY